MKRTNRRKTKKRSTLVIATDGSFRQITGIGSWAFVVLDGPTIATAVTDGSASSYSMELIAVLQAMKHYPNDDLVILCDSECIVNQFNNKLDQWINHNFKSGTLGRGRQHKYWVLWAEINKLRQGRHVQVVHVKGHNGHVLNTAADKAARKARRKYEGRDK